MKDEDLSKYKFRIPIGHPNTKRWVRDWSSAPQNVYNAIDHASKYTVEKIDTNTCIAIRGENAHGFVDPVARVFNAKLLTEEAREITTLLVKRVYPKCHIFWYEVGESILPEKERKQIISEFSGRRQYCGRYKVVRRDFCPSELAFEILAKLQMMYNMMNYFKEELWLVDE